MLEYNVVSDGWIKLDSSEFYSSGKFHNSGRILVGLNQLLLRISGKTVLVDCGLGDKWETNSLNLLDFKKPRRMLSELSSLGVSPKDIDMVILTHLHYDHAGGATHWNSDRKLAPVFENAIYYTQKLELDYALNPDADRVSDYNESDFLPLQSDKRLILLDGEAELLSGLRVYPASGHSPGHQVVKIEINSNVLFFGGDLVPTREHANMTVTSKYDLDPKLVLSNRKKWLNRIKEEKWNCVFCHSIRDHIGLIS